MTGPHRVRVTGWRPVVVPPGAVYVGRGSGSRGQWGNPVKAERPVSAALAVAVYRLWLAQPAQDDLRRRIRRHLAGRDLACWCPPGQVCHGDDLISVATGTWQPPRKARLVVATRGLPGCGKTTWANGWAARLAQLGVSVTRTSRDDVRAVLGFDPACTGPADEQRVTAGQHARIRQGLAAGSHIVIVDDTHLVQAHLQAVAELAATCGADFHVVDLRHVPLGTCIARDAARTGNGHVGEQRIRALAAEHA